MRIPSASWNWRLVFGALPDRCNPASVAPIWKSRVGKARFVGESAQATLDHDAQRHEGYERGFARELCHGRQFAAQQIGQGHRQVATGNTHAFRAFAKGVFDDEQTLALAGDRATTCCSISRLGNASARALTYLRFCGAMPFILGKPPRRSAARQSMPFAPRFAFVCRSGIPRPAPRQGTISSWLTAATALISANRKAFSSLPGLGTDAINQTFSPHATGRTPSSTLGPSLS